MDDEHDIISDWLAREIVPLERAVHGWLSRRWGHVVDAEDVIQEAYCRVASLASIDHIENPKSYFFRTAHAVVSEKMRRAGIISFSSMTQIEWSNVMDDEPLADRIVAADQELRRVNGLLSQLSDTCRRAIEMRRIEGLSRKETAERLGVTENDVKNHLVRGLRKVMKAIADEDACTGGDEPEAVEHKAAVIGKHRSH
ncbi:MAG: sigma-70 family RNA polymerase sigma factor [Sphingomonas sp.]|uniref:RNA polymerase sigma factor n=1 Tax=Sphingomonas sp. TaxID=28214 RepID=UPI001B2D860E|nr:sigma-70 family RNA polymerase sigma factor [Sphingomonas sp.]MBO9621234.1 sigma-70 family RNA polymerase sigma factor [Sphingomonas sp.]